MIFNHYFNLWFYVYNLWFDSHTFKKMVREGVQHFKMTRLLLTKMFSFTVENFKIYESKNFNYDAVTYWKRNEQVRTQPKM